MLDSGMTIRRGVPHYTLTREAISIKTPDEIEGMRLAGRLGAEVLDYITPFVKPGVTTAELDRLCHEYMVNVQGTTPAPGLGSGLGGLLLPVMLIVVFYFLLIRPQQKKQKEHRAMVDALAVGTEIVTGGGVLGKVTEVGEQFLTVEVAEGVTVKVQRHSITAVLPKDTIKHA